MIKDSARRLDAARPNATSSRFLTVAAGMLAMLQAAHLVVRGAEWTIDLPWAVTNYLFSMIFFGPVVAGLGAWQGRAYSRSAWLVRLDPRRALGSFVGPLVLVAVTVYLAGLVAASLMALRRGAPFDVGGEIIDVAVALLAVLAYALIGFAVGSWWHSLSAPAVVGGGAFVATMAGWIGGFETLVRLGGASGGTVGIAVRGDVRVGRVVFWGALVVVSYVAAIRRVRGQGSQRPVAIAASAIAVVGFFWAAAIPQVYESISIDRVCASEAPSICVPTRYERFLNDVVASAAAQPIAREIVAASDRAASSWRLDDSQLFYALSQVNDGVPGADRQVQDLLVVGSQALYAPVCLPDPTVELEGEAIEARDRLAFWTLLATDPTPPGRGLYRANNVPYVALGSAEGRQFIAQMLSQLPACPQ